MKKLKDKSKNAKNKMKISWKNRKQYKIFESKQFLGIILIAVFVYLFVVSIVDVRGFSTINSYTFGMLFGYYSYFFYIGFIILGLSMLFQINVRFEKFIATRFERKLYFSWISYLLLSIGVALVVESIIQWVEVGSPFPDKFAFDSFLGRWWDNFSNKNGAYGVPLLPGIKNSGMIISLFMSLIVSWSGCIVAIIVGLLLIAYFVFYMFYGSIFKKIRQKMLGNSNKKEAMNKKEFEEYKTKIMDLSFEDKSGMVEKPDLDLVSNIEAKTTTIAIDNPDIIFPIDNPFSSFEDEKSHEFVEDKTLQLNLEKNITKEFKINSIENKIKKTPDIETFDFELDIFKTSTDVVNFDINNISLDTKDINLSTPVNTNEELQDQKFESQVKNNVEEVKNNIVINEDDDSIYDSKTIVFNNNDTIEQNFVLDDSSDIETQITINNVDNSIKNNEPVQETQEQNIVYFKNDEEEREE
ncbi:MAG: hypothetical protein HDR43_02610 [Mycoplasma sp.]|nr:hypothetical protein [Mycoplasma sp.]